MNIEKFIFHFFLFLTGKSLNFVVGKDFMVFNLSVIRML